MPIPTPHEGEEKNKFISRCVSSEGVQDIKGDNKQRLAICFSQWKKAHPHSTASIEVNYYIDDKNQIWFF